MKLGFFTACFPDQTLKVIAGWARHRHFEALEIASWPARGGRPFTASHIDVGRLDAGEADRVIKILADHRLTVTSMGYYDNPLHPDPTVRSAVHRHLRSLIDAAAAIGSPTVGTFIGRHPGRTVKQNLREAEQIFPALVDHAGERGVSLVIENCVMEGWHPDGYPGNLAYCPELWEWMFDLGLYLNYDPSHLMWMGIDPVAVIAPYAQRILHVQAKDIEMMMGHRNRYGWPGKAVVREDPWDTGWWRYRVPGHGQVDWAKVIEALTAGGYDGAISIEHEDPVWRGSTERVLTGLEIGSRTLSPLLP